MNTGMTFTCRIWNQMPWVIKKVEGVLSIMWKDSLNMLKISYIRNHILHLKATIAFWSKYKNITNDSKLLYINVRHLQRYLPVMSPLICSKAFSGWWPKMLFAHNGFEFFRKSNLALWTAILSQSKGEMFTDQKNVSIVLCPDEQP